MSQEWNPHKKRKRVLLTLSDPESEEENATVYKKPCVQKDLKVSQPLENLQNFIGCFLQVSPQQVFGPHHNVILKEELEQKYNLVYTYDITPVTHYKQPKIKPHSSLNNHRLNLVINHYIIINAFMG